MFCRHLRKTRMTYIQHAVRALKFCWWSCKMTLACFIHALFPFLLTNTFSENVLKLADDLKKEDING
jgi:hypothetical protein